MRVTLRESRVTLTPGRPATIEATVTNTLDAIDGMTARVLGLDGASVTAATPLLPLFPDTTGRIKLTISVPPTFLAGTHQAEVAVASAVQPDQVERVPLEVEVLPQPGAQLTILPPVRGGRHKAHYDVICTNTGNTLLEVSLAASDPERAVTASFASPFLEVAPGASATTQLSVRARRHFLGGEIGHALTILGAAEAVEAEGQASFRQRPVIPRGARTALLLGVIVAAWAGAFLFGLSKAFAKDPLTKAVPPSFYAASTATQAGGSALGVIQGVSAIDAVPPGAVPKSGVVEGVGGTISGTVIAANTGKGVGRITVEAVRDTPLGPSLVSSAATDTDGTYSLVGVLPGSYKMHFSAIGFHDVWYPAAAGEADSAAVSVDAMGLTAAINATVTGMPGSITGQVDTGQVPPVPVTVEVFPEQGSTTTAIATVTTDATGHYTVPQLPTPGSYDLSFSSTGYQTGSDVVVVGGGEAQVANTMRLSAGPGEIDGVVTDGANPLGAVTITAADSEHTVTSATPTTGAIGHFSIAGLASPGTYLLTFTKTGFGTRTISVLLGPGQVKNDVSVTLVGGTGTISGLVSGPLFPGTPVTALGGATVTVNGGPAPVTTQTLTAGAPGTYVISGLATPGNYTITFSKPGYTSQTLPVNLVSGGFGSGINATLSLSVGVISGIVCTPGVPGADPCPSGPFLGGVTVTVSDGNSADTRMTVTSASAAPSPTASSPAVTFALSGLAPGGYSVTFSLTGYVTQTVFVQLSPGQVATEHVGLQAAG